MARLRCPECGAETFPAYYLDTRTSSKWKSTKHRYCPECDHFLRKPELEVMKT